MKTFTLSPETRAAGRTATTAIPETEREKFDALIKTLSEKEPAPFSTKAEHQAIKLYDLIKESGEARTAFLKFSKLVGRESTENAVGEVSSIWNRLWRAVTLQGADGKKPLGF